jgi:hypothetical protein
VRDNLNPHNSPFFTVRNVIMLPLCSLIFYVFNVDCFSKKSSSYLCDKTDVYVHGLYSAVDLCNLSQRILTENLHVHLLSDWNGSEAVVCLAGVSAGRLAADGRPGKERPRHRQPLRRPQRSQPLRRPQRSQTLPLEPRGRAASHRTASH